jgi:hypothetical protein
MGLIRGWARTHIFLGSGISAKVRYPAVNTVNMVPIFSGLLEDAIAHSNVLSRKEAQIYLLLHFEFDSIRYAGWLVSHDHTFSRDIHAYNLVKNIFGIDNLIWREKPSTSVPPDEFDIEMQNSACFFHARLG